MSDFSVDEWKKGRRLKHVGLSPYIGSGSHVYRGEKYRFLVLERFGQDLGKLFLQNGRRFPLKTVLYLGIQIVSICKQSNLLILCTCNMWIYTWEQAVVVNRDTQIIVSYFKLPVLYLISTTWHCGILCYTMMYCDRVHCEGWSEDVCASQTFSARYTYQTV